MNDCPWCGYQAVCMTTHDDADGFDRRERYACTGPVEHRWREGEGPIPLPPESERRIILAR